MPKHNDRFKRPFQTSSDRFKNIFLKNKFETL